MWSMAICEAMFTGKKGLNGHEPKNRGNNYFRQIKQREALTIKTKFLWFFAGLKEVRAGNTQAYAFTKYLWFLRLRVMKMKQMGPQPFYGEEGLKKTILSIEKLNEVFVVFKMKKRRYCGIICEAFVAFGRSFCGFLQQYFWLSSNISRARL